MPQLLVMKMALLLIFRGKKRRLELSKTAIAKAGYTGKVLSSVYEKTLGDCGAA